MFSPTNSTTNIAMTVPATSIPISLRIISKLLSYSHHFFRRRDSRPHLVPAVFPQTLHPVPPRCRRDLRRILIAHYQLANLVVQLHQLEESHPRGVSGSRTALTTRPAEGFHFLPVRRGPVARRRLAMRTNQPYQPLRQHRYQRGRDQIILHSHVGEPRD